ncbi:di-trans,poly-cis-decaprenylcistransferase [Helicobacter sp. MIT 05-5293]|nr:di-trans,poly-cis-decaprenylcistransferase [Helicobacter sp. MIT 05-5293]
MDGNGRWAKIRNQNRTEGHKEGAKVVRGITEWCLKQKIPYLTLYAFSTENWKRSQMEVDFLMKLLKKYLQSEKRIYLENNIRFRAIGDLGAFDKDLQDAILQLEQLTQNHSALTQILALNYGSQDELSRTFLRILNAMPDSALSSLKTYSPQEMKKMIESHLDTHSIPDVDMLIRTGGEKRISNFMLWQASYAELFFTSTLWPDFTIQEIDEMLQDFLSRQRKFGGV